MHEADKYLLIRKHVFSTFRKYGLKAALNVIDKRHSNNDLNDKHFLGIRGELCFFNAKKDKLKLWESLDSGNHADFVGIVNGMPFGFDVTTNIDTKDLEDYKPAQKGGDKFIVVHVDPNNFKILDYFNINFANCPKCGATMMDVLLLSPSDVDNEGDINYTFTQHTVRVCSANPLEHSIPGKSSNFMTWDYGSFISDLTYRFDDNEDYEQVSKSLDAEITKYSLSNLRFFKKEFSKNIVAVGSPEYLITDPRDGDGYWGTKLYFKSHFARKILPDTFDRRLVE